MVGWFSRMVVAMTIRMPRWFVGWVSRRYVAGPTLEDAVKVMRRLSKEGACFTIDVLGEEISSMEEATFFLEEYKRARSELTCCRCASNRIKGNGNDRFSQSTACHRFARSRC